MRRYFLLITMLCIGLSCKKKKDTEQCVGATIEGYVKNASKVVANAKVFYKRGSHNPPGNDTTLYDGSVYADAKGYYTIDNLPEGDYYLFGYGYVSVSGTYVNVYDGRPFTVACLQQKIKYVDINIDVNAH